MKTKQLGCRTVGSLLLLVFALSGAAQSTLFTFTSAPRGWIGQGQSLFATTNNFTILQETGINPYEVGFVIKSTTPGSNTIWTIELDCPPGYLTNGIYPHAERLGGNPGPGLDFSTSGRGDNTLTGYFEVLNISYDDNHTLLSFAADFVQYDVGVTNLWNQGSLRFNSLIPVPEPTPLHLGAIAGLGIGWRWRKGIWNAARIQLSRFDQGRK